jgi:hypothetical protein
MPQFVVTDPTGRKFQITAPDGATPEQVLAYAQQQQGQRGGSNAPPPPATARQIDRGIAAPPSSGPWNKYAQQNERSSELPPLPPGFTLDQPQARTMDVRMPDGVVVRGVPEGTPRDEIMAKYQRNKPRQSWRDDPVIPPPPPGFTLDQPQSSGETALDRLKRTNPGEYDSASPEYQAKFGATSAMSGPQRFAAGFGKSFVDTGRGLRQLGAEALDFIAPRERTLSSLITGPTSRGDELRARQDDASALDAELMGTGAGIGGNIAGTVTQTLLPGAVVGRGAQVARAGRVGALAGNAARAFSNPTTYKAAIGSGALQGALRPVTTGESRTANTAIGAVSGAAGQGLLNAAGRLAQPIKRALNPQDAKAVEVLAKAGVPLDVAGRTGSKVAQLVKRAVDDNPLTGPGQKAFVEKQQQAFTRATLRLIGEDADAATGDVMDAAARRIGQVFDDVAERNPVRYDMRLHNEIGEISRQAYKELVPGEYAVLGRQIEDIFTKAEQGSGLIDGKAYQNLRTSLGRLSDQRSALGHWAKDLRSTIDGALQRSIKSEADRAALGTARTQYRRMLQIENAIDKDGAGNISASRLANSLGTKSNARQSKYNRGDQQLVRLAQAGKRVLPDKFPNSGTPARVMGQLAVASAAGAGLGGANGDASAGTLAGLGLGAAALLGARGAMNNQLAARYLSEGLRNGIPRQALEGLQRNALARQIPIAAALTAAQE